MRTQHACAPFGRAGEAALIERRDEFDERLLRRLRRCGERLPRRLRIEITAYGARGVRPLCTLLGENGQAPVHAVRLIEEMGVESAIGPLIQALHDTEAGDPLHEEIHRVLEKRAASVLEPLLLAFEAFRDEPLQGCIADVFAASGVRDDRVRALLCGMLETGDAALAAGFLAEYGDPEALPALSRALDAVEDPAPAFRNWAVFEIAQAIEDLGGRLTPAQTARVESAHAAYRRFVAPPAPPPAPAPARRPQRPGRNDPCWCGSGTKYKRCHLDADAAAPA